MRTLTVNGGSGEVLDLSARCAFPRTRARDGRATRGPRLPATPSGGRRAAGTSRGGLDVRDRRAPPLSRPPLRLRLPDGSRAPASTGARPLAFLINAPFHESGGSSSSRGRSGALLAAPRRCRASRPSMPASSTSRCVTARTRSGAERQHPDAVAREGRRRRPARPAPPKMTMFVSTVAASMLDPRQPREALGEAPRRAWSSARRSTWWSSAYRPAAAMMPAWRIAPPSICFQRHASAMSSARAREARADRRAEALREVHPRGVEPSGPRRRRRRRSRRPRSSGARRRDGCAARARARPPATASTCSSGQTRPPPMFVGCSTHTRRGRGA